MDIEYLGNKIHVLGPYANKGSDGRLQVSFNDPVIIGKRRTQSMTRFCVQYALNACILPKYDVDHIDRNHQNNAVENLQILDKKHHAIKDSSNARFIKVKCQHCSKKFLLLWRQYANNTLKQGKAGPYCSRSCAGVASHSENRSFAIYTYEESFLLKDPSKDDVFGIKLIDVFSKENLERYNDILIRLMRTHNARMLEQVYRSGSNPLARESMRVRIPLRAPSPPSEQRKCSNCQKPISSKAKKCKSCAGLDQKKKIQWPPMEELIQMVQESSYLAVGKKLGVSDNAVRKHIAKRNR